MIKAPSRIVLIIAVIFAIGAMVVLNQFGAKNAPKSHEEQEQEETEQAQKAQQEAVKGLKTPAPNATNPGAADDDDLVMLGADKTLGAKNSAAPEVTVRWSWTPAVQNDPTKVFAGIKSLTTAAPQARIHAINSDDAPGQPDGVYVGDKLVSPAAADGAISVDPAAIKQALGK